MDALSRIRNWMGKKNYDGVILGRRDSYAWITRGAENHVVSNNQVGVAYYVITKAEIRLVADSSDAQRVCMEQNPLEGEVIQVPWFESVERILEKMVTSERFVSDTDIAGTKNVLDELIALRMVLSEQEKITYSEVGAACAEIVESICKNAKPGDSERKIAAQLKSSCLNKGINPDCVLVGADSRITDYRHPMPTDKIIEKSLMVVLGGEKQGLNISMTRMVYFTNIPEEIKERYEKTQYIFSCMQAMMREGMSYQEYMNFVIKLYSEAGWEDEWKYHHQGGPTGYQCREWILRPGMHDVMHNDQAYAWNPTIKGTKCEETTILQKQGVITLTRTMDWPCTNVRTPWGTYETANILKY